MTSLERQQSSDVAEMLGGLFVDAHDALMKIERDIDRAYKMAKLVEHPSTGDIFWAAEGARSARQRLDRAYRKDLR